MKTYYSESGHSIFHGDCLAVMPTLAPARFTTVITDPPYELGFMGKGWDSTGVAFRPELWAEVLRVCKPGAMLLAFGGTRTFHRLTCAIEDAGWEIRDCMMWLYGCLSDDTEILVDGRWEPYHKAVEGSRVLAYNPDDETFSWQEVERLYVYDYDDTAYRIESDTTDQIVSRNHRCLVEQAGGGYGFRLAEEAAREREICVPVLEDVQGLLDAVPLPQSHAGVEESDVLAGVRGPEVVGGTEGQAEGRTGQAGNSEVCGVREADHAAGQGDRAGCGSSLQPQMQRGTAWPRMGQAREQGAGELDGEIRPLVPFQDEWPTQPRVEGGRHHLPEARKLRWRSLCPVPGGVQCDGSAGRLRDGTPAARGEGARSMPAPAGGRSSRRPQARFQLPDEPDAVRQQPGPQAIRAPRFTRTDLARITPFHYRGVVWCVKVHTGAFVARRNGKVFVTGNSGFPKSLDLSKAIDKAAGAEREIIGKNPNSVGRTVRRSGGIMGDVIAGCVDRGNPFVTAPATDAAREWSGWGTALKPAWEPIIVAMKPLDGTFAENAQRDGVAGLNIDGGRIHTAGSEAKAYTVTRLKPGATLNKTGGNWRPEEGGVDYHGETKAGRWPANVLLDESAAAQLDGETGEVSGGDMRGFVGGSRPGGFANVGHANGDGKPAGMLYADAGGPSRFFYTAKASKSDRGHGNDHATVKPTALLKYLCKLTAMPTGGEILDPFGGSMTTLVAAREFGRPAVAIEMVEDHCRIGVERLKQGVLFGATA